MADITMCRGTNCPLKESCFRFKAEASNRQSYFLEVPIKENKCEYYWDINTLKTK